MSLLLLQVLAGSALAGFVQGLSGFAFGLVAMGIWARSVSPQLAGPMVVPCLIGARLYSRVSEIQFRRMVLGCCSSRASVFSPPRGVVCSRSDIGPSRNRHRASE